MQICAEIPSSMCTRLDLDLLLFRVRSILFLHEGSNQVLSLTSLLTKMADKARWASRCSRRSRSSKSCISVSVPRYCLVGLGAAGRHNPWLNAKPLLQLEQRVRFSGEHDAQRLPVPTEQGINPWQDRWPPGHTQLCVTSE